jgi:hypothetical protein
VKIFCPVDAAIFIDDPLTDDEDPDSVRAVLIKYWRDGGKAPAQFTVYSSWLGVSGTTITTVLDGKPWAIQIPPKPRFIKGLEI